MVFLRYENIVDVVDNKQIYKTKRTPVKKNLSPIHTRSSNLYRPRQEYKDWRS